MAAGPKLACEIGIDRVVAARAGTGGATLEVHNQRRLPAAAVAPGLSGTNVLEPGALREALSGALGALGGGARDVVAVLPDAAVRVLLIEFEDLPQSADAAAQVIRFRVKKSLPFDVEHAALSYHAQRNHSAVRVVAALSPRAVIEEYEAAFRAAGYEPGVVMPSILATLGLVSAERPALVVKVDPSTTSVALVDRGEMLLVRTLDHPHRAEVHARELLDSIYPSMVFFEDNHQGKVEQILLAGMSDLDGLSEALQSETGVPTMELARTAGGFGSSLGDRVPEAVLTGVAGALHP
jgi:type IV pilus assembly protein PilM